MTTFPASGLPFVPPPVVKKSTAAVKQKAQLVQLCFHSAGWFTIRITLITKLFFFIQTELGLKKIEHGIYIWCYIWFTLPVRDNIKTPDGLNEYHFVTIHVLLGNLCFIIYVYVMRMHFYFNFQIGYKKVQNKHICP